jgi:restriction endonuclease S subunit
MMHELVSSDFLMQATFVPALEEQRQIGMLLASLDNLITLHQREPPF